MKKIAFLALLLFTTLARAEVHEADKMREILPYLTKGTWVVFDIDNTVLEPWQTLGSDQWFEYLVKKQGSLDQAIKIWSAVQRETQVTTVESDTPFLIQSLQKLGYRVFALTARPEELAPTTRRQLLSQDISFEKIISIGPGKSKGEALAAEVRSYGSPSQIIFLDDKEKHARSVDQALSRFSFPHHEFRYGAADAKVKAFNAKVADLQFEYFEQQGVLLSDNEAEEILAREATPVAR